MTASVTALPGVTRLIAVADLSTAERRKSLQWLADAVIAAPHEWPLRMVADVLAIYADPKLTGEQRTEAFTEYLGARRDELDAADGLIVWSDLTDEQAPDGRHESAETIARQNAACALADLAGRDSGGVA